MAQQEKSEKPKKRGMFEQIVTIYKFTAAEDKALPWITGAVFAAPIVVGIICGIVFHWGWVSWITLMILAVMIGLLLFTIVLTRRADNVGYKQMEGKSGAAISILGNMKRAGFDFPQEPVWVDPRTRDAVWRGTGYQGIYLIGEGNYGRVMQAMDRQEKQIKGVTAGSHIPVYRICVGDGRQAGSSQGSAQYGAQEEDVRAEQLHQSNHAQASSAPSFRTLQTAAHHTERPLAYTAAP